MTRDPSHRRPAVLFEPTADGWATTAEVPVNPKDVTCPACHAQPRQPCTARVRRGRGLLRLTGYHDSRIREAETAATAPPPDTSETAPDSPGDARTHPPTGACPPERAETITAPNPD